LAKESWSFTWELSYVDKTVKRSDFSWSKNEFALLNAELRDWTLSYILETTEVRLSFRLINISKTAIVSGVISD
jgi:hypothetical protein